MPSESTRSHRVKTTSCRVKATKEAERKKEMSKTRQKNSVLNDIKPSQQGGLLCFSKEKKNWKPHYFKYALIFVGLFLTTSLLSNLSLFTRSTSGHTSLKSLASNKSSHMSPVHSKKKISFIKGHHFSHTQKLSSPIRVTIHKVGDQEFTPSNPLQLMGTVITQRDTSQLDITWHIPKSVQILSGQKKVTISNAQAGKAYNVSLTILTENTENEQIHLLTGMSLGNLRFSNSTTYNTALQKAFEKSKKALSERARAFSSLHHRGQ